jgi:hypothetical protein
MSTYRERLTASAAWWIGTLLLGAALGWIVLVPTTWTLGIGTFVGVTAFFGLLLWQATLVVAISESGLSVGRATLTADFVGVPIPLDAPAYRRRLGTEADARAFLATRPWVDRGVLVPVTDPGDPAPYWIVGSRDPQRLAAAIVKCTASGGERH